MFLIQPSTLLLAAVIASPALWHGFVKGDLSLTATLGRFLLAVAVSAVMLSVLRGLTAGYRRSYARRVAEKQVAEAETGTEPEQ